MRGRSAGLILLIAISAMLAIVVAAYLGYLSWCTGICHLDTYMPKASITIYGAMANYTNVPVYIAGTISQQTLGYMDAMSLGDHCNMSSISGFNRCDPKGMLFVFSYQANECFWMKDTIMPLEQAWIGSNGAVLYVYNATPYSTTDICHQGMYVLETNATYLPIHVGDKVVSAS